MYCVKEISYVLPTLARIRPLSNEININFSKDVYTFLMNNFPPASVLHTIDKILEKLTHIQLNNYQLKKINFSHKLNLTSLKTATQKMFEFS